MTTQMVCHELPVGIPTAMTETEAHALQMISMGENVLEIGSLLGYSTIVLARVARRVWAIDPHEGYPVSDPRPTLDGFMQNLELHGVRDKVVPIIGRAQDVLPSLRSHFGVIFIDITRHAKELIFLANNLDPRYIAIHDYKHPEWTGSTEAVDAFFQIRSYPMQIVDRLAIIDISAGRDGYYE